MKQYRTQWLSLLAVVLFIGGLPSGLPAQDKIDPVGMWELQLTPRGGAAPAGRPRATGRTAVGRPGMVPVLRLEKTGDNLVGAINFMGQNVPIKDVQFKDGEISFNSVTKARGQEFKLSYKAKFSGDIAKGEVTGNFGTRTINFDLEGKRVRDDLTGSWKITVVLESGQKLQPTLRLKQEGSRVSGNYIGSSGKDLRVQGIKFNAGELSFRVADEIGQDKVNFEYSGKVAGDTIAGTAKLGGAGSQTVSLKFEAQKVKTPTAMLGGTWKLTVPFQDGVVFEPTLKLVQQGIGLSGTYVGEQGETAIADALVMGDEFAFEVSRERDGKKYRLRYQGKVKGDALKGNVDYDFDGMAGSLDFDGKRIAGPEKK
jgi:hypothetical protein